MDQIRLTPIISEIEVNHIATGPENGTLSKVMIEASIALCGGICQKVDHLIHMQGL